MNDRWGSDAAPPEAVRPVAERAQGQHGGRGRAIAAILAGLLIVGAGAWGRIEADRVPRPAVRAPTPVPATARPVGSPMALVPPSGRVAPPGQELSLPRIAPRPRPPTTPAETLPVRPGVLAVIALQGSRGGELRMTLPHQPDGSYQGAIPLRLRRDPVAATLRLYPPARRDAYRDGSLTALPDGTLGTFPIHLDSRPFPPGPPVTVLYSPPARVPHAYPPLDRSPHGLRVSVLLLSDGTNVELALYVGPLPVAGAVTSGRPTGPSMVPCPREPSVYRRLAPDRTTNC